MEEHIEIIIEPDGSSASIDMKGWQGKVCLDKAREIARLLGDISQIQKKPEFMARERERRSVSVGRRGS